MRCIILFLTILLANANSYSQCFSSPGNPIGGNANMGILDKNLLRVITFFRHSESNKNYIGDKLCSVTPFKKSGVYNYGGVLLGYGLTNKINLETELGYFINKTQTYNLTPVSTGSMKGFGFSNAVISAKINVFSNPVKRFEISAALGVKIPLTNKAQILEGVELPVELQSSTGSYGFVIQTYIIKENSFSGYRFFLINRYERNFENSTDFFTMGTRYKFGNVLYSSLYISKHLHFRWDWLTENWTAILQIRNEVKSKNERDGVIVDASGGSVFFIAPQLNYTLKKKWNISVLVDIPVYQYYNKTQLANSFAFAINLTRDISFSKTLKEMYEF